MPPATILKFPTSSPADTTPLTSLEESGFDTKQILGIVGKTEGNGCVNDFSRTLSSHAWDAVIPKDAISIFSGGTEGVLSPHVSTILKSDKVTGLIAAVSRSRVLEPWEVGTPNHVRSVAETIRSMLAVERIEPGDVQFVLIKCPLLTSSKVAAIQNSGRTPVTTDTYESMVSPFDRNEPDKRSSLTRKALSRYASAVGIGAALGELDDDHIVNTLANGNFYTSRGSCSSGAELDNCHILILANDGTLKNEYPPASLLRAFGGVMTTAIDFQGLQAVLSEAMTPEQPYRKATLVQAFAKAEADPSGLVAGKFRHTMLTDSDLHSTRHARAAVGGLIAGVTGDCHVYVSGGAEGRWYKLKMRIGEKC